MARASPERPRIAFDPKMNREDRGSFTEILETAGHGSFSVDVAKRGVAKGQHWHSSKWGLFVVASVRAIACAAGPSA